MADINGVTIACPASGPAISYTFSYSCSRPDNTHMRYVFSVTGWVTSSGYLGTWSSDAGSIYGVITINGSSSSRFQIKKSSEAWYSGERHTVSDIVITCSSTNYNSTLGVSISMTRGSGGGSAGVLSNSSYTVVTLGQLGTRCGPPKNVKFTSRYAPDLPYFDWYNRLAEGYDGPALDDELIITWDDADGGQNNAVDYYQIQGCYGYNQYDAPDGSGWYDKDSPNRGNRSTVGYNGYTDSGESYGLRIRTVGTAGESLASDWVTWDTGVTVRQSARAVMNSCTVDMVGSRLKISKLKAEGQYCNPLTGTVFVYFYTVTESGVTINELGSPNVPMDQKYLVEVPSERTTRITNGELMVDLPESAFNYPGTRLMVEVGVWSKYRDAEGKWPAYSTRVQLYTDSTGQNLRIPDGAFTNVYNGTDWVMGKVYCFNGSAWVPAKSVNVFDGSNWKRV